jgi:hypothetical protein
MVVVLTYWLSYEYVRDPRRALEPESAAAALSRGAYHVLSLLMPYLEPQSREHLQICRRLPRQQRLTLFRSPGDNRWPSGPPFPTTTPTTP